MQNLVDVERRKGGLRRWQILAYFWFFFVHFASRPGHTVGAITKNKGLKRVFLCKEVPFKSLDNKK